MTKRTKEILDRLDAAYGTEYRCYLNRECLAAFDRGDLKRPVHRCQSEYRDEGSVSEIRQAGKVCRRGSEGAGAGYSFHGILS